MVITKVALVLFEVLVFIARIQIHTSDAFQYLALGLCPLECISWSGLGGSEEGEGGEEDSQKHRHRTPIYVLSPSYPCWSPKKSFGNIGNTMDRRTKVSFYFGI